MPLFRGGGCAVGSNDSRQDGSLPSIIGLQPWEWNWKSLIIVENQDVY
jgi:hypothetical protein